MKFEGKKIGIIGLGKSGYWASKLAKSIDCNVFASDSNSNLDLSIVDDLKNIGVEVETGEHSNRLLDSDIIIK